MDTHYLFAPLSFCCALLMFYSYYWSGKHRKILSRHGYVRRKTAPEAYKILRTVHLFIAFSCLFGTLLWSYQILLASGR